MAWLKKQFPFPHKCDLPKIKRNDVALGDVWQCDECGSKYEADYGPTWATKDVLEWDEHFCPFDASTMTNNPEACDVCRG